MADPAECRALGLAGWQAYKDAVENGRDLARICNPKPGDLVLEITTAFRWFGDDRLAPGEALGWLLRIEGDAMPEYVLRPVYEADGEFRWANSKFIVVEPDTDAMEDKG